MSAFVIPSIFTAIDRFTAPVAKMRKSLFALGDAGDAAGARIERRFLKISDSAKTISKGSLLMAAAVIAPLALAGNAAVKFEDKLTDVAKTTNLVGSELEAFGKDVLKMSRNTRTSVDDLLTIAEIGGQAGIANKDLIGFTESVNKFNVALGKDFSGGVEEATMAMGKIRGLFKETRDINVAESINRTGSAINELGAQGAGTSANIADFALRVGALPAALKPGIQSTLALGTLLEEAGVVAEIGAGGITKFLLDAGNKLGGFAKQMGITKTAAQKLLAEDPTAFITKFAVSLNKLKPEQLAKKLKVLGIGSQESIKVLGAIGSQSERLAELMKISNSAFSEAISLNNEYNKKNETTAARLAKLKNRFNELVIVAGERLIPVIEKIVEIVSPYVEKITEWSNKNKDLSASIIKVVVAFAGILIIVGIVAGIVSAVSMVVVWFTKFWGVLTLIGGFLSNFIIPIFQFLIASIAAVIETIAAFLGVPVFVFLLIISLIMSVVRNWDYLVEAFQNKGLLGSLKAIGAVLLDAILWPVQKILELVSYLPDFLGGGIAGKAAAAIDNFRKNDLGLNVESQQNTSVDTTASLLNPKAAEQEGLVQKMEQTNHAKVDINVNDPASKVNVNSENNFVRINTGSTWGVAYGM